MPDAVFTVEEPVYDDFDRGATQQRFVRFVHEIHGDKWYEIFLKDDPNTHEVLAKRVVPEGSVCAQYLKEALADTVERYGPMPSDLQIGTIDGRVRTVMEFQRKGYVKATV